MLSMSHLLAGYRMKTHNSTVANLCRGVGERVLFTDRNLTPPIRPSGGVFRSRLALYRDRLVRTVGYQSPVTRDEFADFYKGPRYQTYRRAVDGLALLPFRPRDATLKTFVKAEKLNLDIKSDPVPRVIQPRDPRFNVEVGRYLRPLEKKVYAAINELYGSPVIMSEFNSYTQAEKIKDKWDKFYSPVCIGLDASRFDQHVSAQALRFEHEFYDMIFRSKELRALLRHQIDNRGIAVASDGSFRYSVHGGRMSGDMNTSLGNKFLMCLMAKAYIDSVRVPVEFVNNGDDCLMILDSKHLSCLDNLSDYFRDFGFKIVREAPVYEFEQIEFCQTKPVCVNGVWRMIRGVKSCFGKDVTCILLGHDVAQYRAWLYDVATCGLATAGDVPVLGAFYRMLLRFGRPGFYHQGATKEYQWYFRSSMGATCKHDTPDSYGRYSFWLSTGISPDEQGVIESALDAAVWGANERQLIDFLRTLIDG